MTSPRNSHGNIELLDNHHFETQTRDHAMSVGPCPRARFRAPRGSKFWRNDPNSWFTIFCDSSERAQSPITFILLLGGGGERERVPKYFGVWSYKDTRTFPIISFIMSTKNHSELTSTENQSPFSSLFSSIFVKTNVLIGLFQYVDLTRLHIFVYNEGSMNEIHYVFVPIHIVW